jgi:hypothetical protein
MASKNGMGYRENCFSGIRRGSGVGSSGGSARSRGDSTGGKTVSGQRRCELHLPTKALTALVC